MKNVLNEERLRLLTEEKKVNRKVKIIEYLSGVVPNVNSTPLLCGDGDNSFVIWNVHSKEECKYLICNLSSDTYTVEIAGTIAGLPTVIALDWSTNQNNDGNNTVSICFHNKACGCMEIRVPLAWYKQAWDTRYILIDDNGRADWLTCARYEACNRRILLDKDIISSILRQLTD